MEQLSKYLENKINTASSEGLAILLLDKVSHCLEDAITAIENKNPEQRWKSNTRACDILHFLANNVDYDKEVGVNLAHLLLRCMAHLSLVDHKNSPEAARDVIAWLQPIRDAFAEYDKNSISNNNAHYASGVQIDA